jgi:hypothetical protein
MMMMMAISVGARTRRAMMKMDRLADDDCDELQ